MLRTQSLHRPDLGYQGKFRLGARNARQARLGGLLQLVGREPNEEPVCCSGISSGISNLLRTNICICICICIFIFVFILGCALLLFHSGSGSGTGTIASPVHLLLVCGH